jgi:hypothetical protein
MKAYLTEDEVSLYAGIITKNENFFKRFKPHFLKNLIVFKF